MKAERLAAAARYAECVLHELRTLGVPVDDRDALTANVTDRRRRGPIPSIPPHILKAIVRHRPHLAHLVANIPLAPVQCEKALAVAYLAGETRLSASDTWALAACTRGLPYGS